jgi:hypothetical protein
MGYFLFKKKRDLSLQSHKKTSRKTSFSLFALVLVIVISTISTSFMQSTANAASTSLTTALLSNQARSYAYENTLYWCIGTGGILEQDGGLNDNQISQAHAFSGQEWWQDNQDPPLNTTNYARAPSYLIPPLSGGDGTSGIDTKGNIRCNSVLHAALTFWGYDTTAEIKAMFCAFVPYMSDGSTCLTGPSSSSFGDISSRKTAFRTVIEKRTGISSYSSAMLYTIYDAAFMSPNGCDPTKSASPGKNDGYKDVKTLPVTSLDSTTSTAVPTATTYEGLANSTTINVYTKSDTVSTQEAENCTQIAAHVNQYASAYVTYVGAHQPKKATPVLAGCTAGATTDADGDPCDGGGSGSAGTSCGIPGVGWIVCPVLTFIESITDTAYQFISQTFLQTNTALVSSDSTSSTYIAWQAMRNIANIGFVIAFLLIIFSQITSIGITNYGVKKLLPRLVIAAILVNISFFICQVAVDLSNILGSSLNNFLANIIQIPSTSGTNDTGNGLGWVVIGAALAGTAVIAYFSLAIFIPMLLGALVAILMIALMLIARQAIIVILVIIAPLAFVAFLLPNTQSWFDKWRKALFSLLMLYPVIAVVFGASKLASNIIAGIPGAYSAGQGGASQDLLPIIAMGTAALPLFIVPGLLKKSLDGVGSVGQKLNSFAAKAGSGLGKAGSKAFSNTALQRGRELRKQGRAEYRNQKFAKGVAGEGSRFQNLRGRVARGGNITKTQRFANEAMQRSAIGAAAKAQQEETSFAQQALQSQVASGRVKAETVLAEALRSGDKIKARAASNVLFDQGSSGVDKFAAAVSSAQANGTASREVLSSVRENITTNHGQYIKGKAKDVVAWASDPTGASIESKTADISNWTMSASDLAGQTPERLRLAASAGNINPELATTMLDDPRIFNTLDDDQKAALTIAKSSSQEAYNTKLAKSKQDKAFGTYVEAGNVPAETTSPAPTQTAPAPLANRAQATAAQAAQGSAGDAPFVVSHDGVANPNSATGEARTTAAEAAAGSAGTTPFVVDPSGSAQPQRTPGSNGSYVDEQGRETPNGTADPEGFHDWFNK